MGNCCSMYSVFSCFSLLSHDTNAGSHDTKAGSHDTETASLINEDINFVSNLNSLCLLS